MSSSILTNVSVLSKFRGCMIGGLIGDCLGAPFEGDSRVSKRILEKFMSNLLTGDSIQIFPYTDDTAMTCSIARSLVEKEKIDPKDIAERFVTEFFKQPQRNYGVNVVDVFGALRSTEFKDVYLPAKLQFNGSGSYGNGAAMRIAPISLFESMKNDNDIKDAVEACSLLTHTHPYGYNGAVLQCFAVHTALKADPTKELNPVDFVTQLENKMKTIETKENQSPYCDSLKKIKEIYFQNQINMSPEEIAGYLGNNVSAQKSVPTAIYSFLRGIRPLEDYECVNPFVRTIYYAIAVGGDTDTIASMAGSIAGAFYGAEAIPEELQTRCEMIDEVRELAEKLYNVSQSETS